ncbi:MAG: hypothetical protein IKS31_01625 [Clostridia bacterium]|nr:hypothetical protein [Clostridia bacterium]
MTEQKEVGKAKKLWTSALRTVKGDTTQTLVENFTAEMTMVVEGLCEDQAKIRSRMDELQSREDRDRQSLDSDIRSVENMLREQQEASDQRLRTIEGRLDVIEKSLNRKEKIKKRLFGGNLIGQLIILAAIVCGAWVIVTIVNKF